jgi:hypothetical protein
MSYIGRSFYENIGMGAYSNIVSWAKIGFSPVSPVTDTDIWSYSGTQPNYLFPTAAAGMEVTSSDNTQDIGTVIKGNAQGSSAILCDAGGTTTTLLDLDGGFLNPTIAAIGDILLIDPTGTTPEWGYITAVSSSSLTFAGGLSSGGSCATARAYTVLDYSAKTGAFAVKMDYLDGSYNQKTEITILNGTAVIPTVNLDLFRINSFRVIATGSGNKPVGNLMIRNLADTPVYSYITLGFTRARNTMYTVPNGKTLYVNKFVGGFSLASGTKWEYGRIHTRANREPSTGFLTGSLFYSYTEIIANNSSVSIDLSIPTKLPAKTDIKVSCLASATGGSLVSTLRGFLTTP